MDFSICYLYTNKWGIFLIVVYGSIVNLSVNHAFDYVNLQVQANCNSLSRSIVTGWGWMLHKYWMVLEKKYFCNGYVLRITFDYVYFLYYLSAENGLNIILMSNCIYIHVSYVAFFKHSYREMSMWFILAYKVEAVVSKNNI